MATIKNIARRLGRTVFGEAGYKLITPSSATSTTIVSTADLVSTAIDNNFYRGWWVMRRDAATSADRVRRVTSFTASTGTLTVERSYSDTTVTGEDVELWRYLNPDTDVLQIITEALRRCKHANSVPLASGEWTDGHMDDSGTTAWTASNATLSKVTTAARVHWGLRALRVQNSAAGGYAYQRLGVHEDEAYWVVALCNADVGTAKLEAYDATNAASIESVTATADHVDLPILMRIASFSIPSGCRQLEIRLVGSAGATDDIYWSFCVPLKANDRRLRLPTSGTHQIFEGRWITGLSYWVPGREDTTGVSLFEDHRLHQLTGFEPEVNRTWTNAAHLRISQLASGYPHFVELYRPYVDDNNEPSADSTGDATDFNVPYDYVIPMCKDVIAEHIFSRTALGMKLPEIGFAESMLQRWQAEAVGARNIYELGLKRRPRRDTWRPGVPFG